LFSFLIAVSNATSPPYLDLSQSSMNWVYWISQSGKYGAPVIAVLALALLVSRHGIDSTRKKQEIVVVVLTASILASGGALANEYFIKTGFQVPRPNIVWLAGENGSGPLGMTAEEFYSVGGPEARSTSLATVLQQQSRPVHLTPSIEAHWIEETGFSLPSGHAFSAMFFATFLILLGATFLTARRFWLLYSLLLWALAVCYSRPLLGVHTAVDVMIGASQGIVIGVLAWKISINLMRRTG
jgi:phosphatidylglycerophosphatase B